MKLITYGIVTEVYDKVYYENSKGKYVRRKFVILTTDSHPVNVLFDTYSNIKKSLPVVELGKEVVVSFRIKSNKVEDKWYTNLEALSVEPMVLDSIGIGG
ncbi:MAG TPA: DUF3127 domain-containing protein [Cytophagaceae bacterium]|jgi:hypothetical protein|nr:DUF3127 domain-containing protein [Cytophagaceae bacterium]